MKQLLAIALFFLPVICFAQITISGRVLNQADRKPIPDVSVFLSNSSVGTKTADDGAFSLKNVKPGKYQLVISIIGFEKHDQTIIVTNSNITLPEILILPKTTVLNEVNIKAVSDADRAAYYKLFKEEFLGASEQAKDCTIVNPETLNFVYDKKTGVLAASSPDFLIIENKALGYNIKYLLSGFRLYNGPSAKYHLEYAGSVLFEQMKGTLVEEKRWQKRRQEVYEPSLMHFLRAALDNRIEQQNFRALLVKRYTNPARPQDSIIEAKIKFYKKLKSEGTDKGDSLSFWVKKGKLPKTIDQLTDAPLNKNEIIKSTNQQGVFAFGPEKEKDAFLVTYNKDQHFTADWLPYYLNSRNNNESTLVDFSGPYVFFDSNGAVFNPDSLIFSGVWGRDRVAELLPVDYEPSQKQPGNSVAAPAENLDRNTGDGVNLKNNLLTIIAKSDSASAKAQPEKAYLQFDKPYYALGDTIWFKAYLLNDFLMPSDKSGVINIDIANDSNKVVRRYRMPMASGLSWGNISLDANQGFTTGTYTLRAYTNWMCNFGDEYFFYKTFYISDATGPNFLVNTRFSTSAAGGASLLTTRLAFSDINKTPLAAAPLQLSLMDGNKRLDKQRLQTAGDGALDINFNIPGKASHLAIVAADEQNNKKVVIPIDLNRPENADVQFLPEGGDMVAGLPAHIGFKAIGENGKGMDVSGIITDHNQNQVAQFKSLHKGIGSFDLAVTEGETYTAKITLPGGVIKEYTLPPAKKTGTVLKVKNPAERDSLTVIVAATDDVVRLAGNYFLIGKARGIICYAAVFNFNQGNSVQQKIAKSLFPAGITHFSVLTTKYQPLNERMAYIDHPDNLDIKLMTNKGSYGPRDSVAVKIKVTYHNGGPAAGNFSLAVTDNAQVKTDSSNSENLVTRMLLRADLKGYIEEPGYYLSSKTPEAWQELDNLLLTQGWIGYDWKQVLDLPVFAWQPGTDLAITGHVTNVMNKPLKGTDILLFSNKPRLLIDTATDNNGRFVFDRLPKVDTPVFMLRAVNKRGKSFNVNVTIDEAAQPVFTKPPTPAVMPWYINTDGTLLAYAKHAALKQQADFTPGGHLLSEVKIKAKKIVKNSENLNGPGNADFVMDENDLEAAGKKSWLQLLEENLKGFREGEFHVNGHSSNAIKEQFLNSYVTDYKWQGPSYQWYFINGKPVKIIVDGVAINQLVNTVSFRDLRDYLSHSAEDIKGLEVISSSKYAAAYLFRYDPYDPKTGEDLITQALTYSTLGINIGSSDVSFIEITTRSGHGPAIDNTPGMYLYKPLAISWPKQFYKPKYKVTDTVSRLDYRTTIDWEPNVVTDASGEATLWFYAADKPSTYTVRIEGTDMKGHLGFKQATIKVGEKEKAK